MENKMEEELEEMQPTNLDKYFLSASVIVSTEWLEDFTWGK